MINGGWADGDGGAGDDSGGGRGGDGVVVLVW